MGKSEEAKRLRKEGKAFREIAVTLGVGLSQAYRLANLQPDEMSSDQYLMMINPESRIREVVKERFGAGEDIVLSDEKMKELCSISEWKLVSSREEFKPFRLPNGSWAHPKIIAKIGKAIGNA
jgi:hypothetical protein